MGYKVEDEPDRTIPEDTILRGVLEEVSEKDIEWTDKGTGEKKSATLLQWWFRITDKRDDGLYEGRKVRAECDARLTNHPGNRFRNIAEALIGRELALGTEIDPQDDLVGLPADLTVSHRKYEKNGEERIAEQVDEIIAVSGDEQPF